MFPGAQSGIPGGHHKQKELCPGALALAQLTSESTCRVWAPPIQSPAFPKAQPQQGEKGVAYPWGPQSRSPNRKTEENISYYLWHWKRGNPLTAWKALLLCFRSKAKFFILASKARHNEQSLMSSLTTPPSPPSTLVLPSKCEGSA